MIKILIWGTGITYDSHALIYKYYEEKHYIQVIGITSSENMYTHIDGYKFIPVEEISQYKFDFLVIEVQKKSYHVILKEAFRLGIDTDKVIPAKIFCMPNFNLDKYLSLRTSNISIISNNCWGGITYNSLYMQFKSPFINMYMKDSDYLKMLQNFSLYINSPLVLKEMAYEETLKTMFPVYTMQDVSLFMNHYTDCEVALQKWNERKLRLNGDNLFIMMHTSNKEIAKEFDKLNFKKKVCFVPFKTDLPSVFTLQYNDLLNKGVPFWKIVNGSAVGTYKSYDVIEMLLEGKNNKSKRAIY